MKNEKCLKTTSKKALHRFTALAAVLLAVCLVFMTPVAAEVWDGSTVDTTTWYNDVSTEFTISTPAQLAGLAKLVNEGNTFEGKTIKLDADIDLGGKQWTPIGTYTGDANSKPFSGIFDGNSKTISNLEVTGTHGVGLFGNVNGASTSLPQTWESVYSLQTDQFTSYASSYSAKVGNFNLINVDVSGTKYVGSAVGYSQYAYIYKITVGSDEEGDTSIVKSIDSGTADSLGGVVGRGVSSFIDGCINKASVSGTGYNVGGIVGAMRTTESIIPVISGCENFGTITYTLTQGGLGGICGQSSATVVIYNSKNHESVSGSVTSSGIINSANSVVSGILGTSNSGNIIVNCINAGDITGSGTYSLSGIYGRSNGDSWVINCKSSGRISGNAERIGGIIASVDNAGVFTLKNPEVTATIQENSAEYVSKYVCCAPSERVALIFDTITINSVDDFKNSLPYQGGVKFNNPKCSADSFPVYLTSGVEKLDLSGVTALNTFSVSALSNSDHEIIFPASAQVTFTDDTSISNKLTISGNGVTFINKGKLGSLVIENSNGVTVQNEGIFYSLSFSNSDSGVVINTKDAVIGSNSGTASTHAVNIHSNSDYITIHNSGHIFGSSGYFAIINGNTTHRSYGHVLLNYHDAIIKALDSNGYLIGNMAYNEAFSSKIFAFPGSIKYLDDTNYALNGYGIYNANLIYNLTVTYTGNVYEVGSIFTPDESTLVVKANFTEESGYEDMELPHSWLVFENTEITAGVPVTVSFLGKFETEIPGIAPPADDDTGGDNTGDDDTGGDNTGGDNTGGDDTGGDNTGDDDTRDNNTQTGGSGKDTGSGNYQYYPRDVPTNGIVSFGSSKVVKGMELPAGSDGTVTLNTKPTFAMPENGFYAFEIDAPGYNLEAKINGGLSFQIPVADLEAEGFTANDIVLFHGTVAEDGKITWEALPTNLVKVENGIAYYKAAINGCSPFYIGFVEDGSVVNTEVVDPTTPETPETPVTPDEPEVLPPVDEPETPEQPTESPAPILAVLAGLGAAVVLRRK